MPTVGWPELIIILVVVLLVFGVGRISKVGSELGKGIQAFRRGIREGREEIEESEKDGKAEEIEALRRKLEELEAEEKNN